jgi:hypothetical protein
LGSAGTFILGFVAGSAICAAVLVTLAFLVEGALGSLFWLALMLGVAWIAWTRGRKFARRMHTSIAWLPAGSGLALLVAMALLLVVAVMSSD